jgi:hypothetical protein
VTLLQHPCDSLLATLAPTNFEPPAVAFERQRLQQQREQLVLRLAESLDISEGAPTVNLLFTIFHDNISLQNVETERLDCS